MSAHDKAYAGGAISKQIVTEAHENFWDPYVDAQFEKCQSKSETKVEFDECMGPAAHNEKVVEALKLYNKAAAVLFTVLKSTESSDDDVRTAKQKAIDAAIAVIALMGPEAAPYLEHLEALVK